MGTVIEVDCTTGISTEREMTDEEVTAQAAMAAQAEADAKAKAEADAAQAAQLAATNAKLMALGLTQADIDALLKAAKA
jgi:hypothetical protein